MFDFFYSYEHCDLFGVSIWSEPSLCWHEDEICDQLLFCWNELLKKLILKRMYKWKFSNLSDGT